MTSRVQTLRSSTTGNVPAAGTRAPGELWANFPDLQMGVIDASKTAQRLIAVRYFSTNANYAVGDVVVQAGALYIAKAVSTAGAFNATNWLKVAVANDSASGFMLVSGGTFTGPIVAPAGSTIAGYLPLVGGTLTGALVLAADPATALGAATRQYVDAGVTAANANANAKLPLAGGTLTGPLILSGPPSVPLGAATKAYVDAGAFLPIGGGTLTGPLLLAADPTTPLGAATKEYVDAGGAGGFINKFRNPGFDIWQRGTPFSAGNGTYTADGIVAVCIGATPNHASGARLTGSYSRSSYNMSAASGLTVCSLLQRIESYVAALLAGRTVTFQARVLNNMAAAITPTLATWIAGTQDVWTSPTADLAATNLQTIPAGQTAVVSYTLNVSANATLGYEAILGFGGALNAASGGVATTDWDIRVTPGAALGLNANPPPPEIRPIGVELPICQRYYYAEAVSVTISGYAVSSGTNAAGHFFLPQPMRASPSVIAGTFNSAINCTGAIAMMSSRNYRGMITSSAAGGFYATLTATGFNADI